MPLRSTYGKSNQFCASIKLSSLQNIVFRFFLSLAFLLLAVGGRSASSTKARPHIAPPTNKTRCEAAVAAGPYTQHPPNPLPTQTNPNPAFLAAPVGGIAVRIEEQGHMVVLLWALHLKDDGHLPCAWFGLWFVNDKVRGWTSPRSSSPPTRKARNHAPHTTHNNVRGWTCPRCSSPQPETHKTTTPLSTQTSG